jgi:hypothetical protein
MIKLVGQNSEENDTNGSVLATTPNGKKIILKQHPFGLWYMCFADGGQLPKVLNSKYTHAEDAKKAAEGYVFNMPAKKEKTDKE